MVVYSNILPAPETNGITYATNVPMTSTEADLGDGLLSPRPIPADPGLMVVAVVQLTVVGYIVSSNCYVVLQTDMGDGVWIDAAWFTSTINQGTSITALVAGGDSRVLGTGSNTIPQTRAPGTFPSSTLGSSIVPLMGRIRLVGLALASGGSSSAPGAPSQILSTIKYRMILQR